MAQKRKLGLARGKRRKRSVAGVGCKVKKPSDSHPLKGVYASILHNNNEK